MGVNQHPRGGVVAIGLIPARGGSKGIVRKNIAIVAGRPLLAWTAEAALEASRLAGAVLSTDDEEIASVGRSCGLEVPFQRPAELASDTAPSIDVVMHAVAWLDAAGRRADVIVLLQPTAPLRTAEDIDGALSCLESSGADSVVSVAEVPSHFAPEWQLRLSPASELRLLNDEPLSAIVPRRQLLPKTYYRNGALYAVRREVLTSRRSLYGDRCVGYPMPAARSVNIDGPEELAEAERLLLGRRA